MKTDPPQSPPMICGACRFESPNYEDMALHFAKEHPTSVEVSPQSPPAGEGLDAVIKHEPYGRNGSYRCLAHSEGQLCCTDPEHPDYPQLKAQLRAYILAQVKELIRECTYDPAIGDPNGMPGYEVIDASELLAAAHARFGTDKEGAEQ